MDAYDGKTEYHQNIGMGLAIAGNLVISIALNITKYAHNLNQQSETPVPFMCMPLWWMGFLLTAFGEVGNFAAYGFGEASLIAPLGAVAVLANAFIASVFLGERFRCVDAIGCVLCVAGGVIIVRSVPSHPSELDPDGFLQSLEATPFVVYIATVTALVSLMLYFQDRYGELHVAYYVLLCSLLGSITVMSCKGVSTFVNLWLCCGAPSPFGEPIMYALCLVLGSTAVAQVNYLNKAMERFGNTETVPVYYVLFTLTTISGSNVLFRDFEHEDRWTVITFALGCLSTFVGVKLLTSRPSRSYSVSAADEKRTPMLANAHPAGAHDAPPHAAADEALPHEPALHALFMAPATERPTQRPTQRELDLEAMSNASSFDDLSLVAGTPILSGSELRNAPFSSRLEAFSHFARVGAGGGGARKHRNSADSAGSGSADFGDRPRLKKPGHQRMHSV